MCQSPDFSSGSEAWEEEEEDEVEREEGEGESRTRKTCYMGIYSLSVIFTLEVT